MKAFFFIYFFVFLFFSIFFSCSTDVHFDLEKLSGEGVIRIDSDNVSGKIGKVFSKYVYYTAPNGKRINIFGTSGVSDQQMIYAKKILIQYLTIDGEKYKRKHKKLIANSMANKKAAMSFFDTQEMAEKKLGEIIFTGFNFQDLYATESYGSTDRDASYEEILHLVHNYGIDTTLKEYQDRVQKANDSGIKNEIWNPSTEDLPVADYDDEYLAAVMDCYLGLWKDKTSTMEGEYKPFTKENLKQYDPEGYQLIVDLFGDIQLITDVPVP